MENENGKDCAFPNTFEVTQGGKGLTKREYFAGLAMQGICSNNHRVNLEDIGKLSVEIADNILKAFEEQ